MNTDSPSTCYTQVPCPPFSPDEPTWHLYGGPMVFFHGGAPGLKVGGWLLPLAETGVKGSDQYADYAPGAYWPDHVYLSTDIQDAKMFAAFCTASHDPKRGGDVYRVVPVLPLSLDPDAKTEGRSWMSRRARIVGIAATGVRRAPFQKAMIDEARTGYNAARAAARYKAAIDHLSMREQRRPS